MNDLFGTNGSGKRSKPSPAAQPPGTDYSAKDTEVLEGLAPVRRRPCLLCRSR